MIQMSVSQLELLIKLSWARDERGVQLILEQIRPGSKVKSS